MRVISRVSTAGTSRPVWKRPRLYGRNNTAEFADAIAEAIRRDVLALGPAHQDKVPRCANSCEGIDPYHRPIDSSRWFWLNRICVRIQPRAFLQLGKSRK